MKGFTSNKLPSLLEFMDYLRFIETIDYRKLNCKLVDISYTFTRYLRFVVVVSGRASTSGIGAGVGNTS